MEKCDKDQDLLGVAVVNAFRYRLPDELPEVLEYISIGEGYTVLLVDRQICKRESKQITHNSANCRKIEH